MGVRDYDFVVVGAGSAGCVIASRLSENPDCSVLLLESGGADTNPWIHIPLGYAKTLFNPTLNWRYPTEPEPGLDMRSIDIGAGRVLGGSSSINGMVYIRGQREDYDEWARLGNTGWAYDDVLPIFKKMEKQQDINNRYHGTNGELYVSASRLKNPICDAFIAASNENRIPHTHDFNGEVQEGAGYFQFTQKNGLRWSAARAFLATAKQRKNLTVLTRAHASRVHISSGKVRGISFIHKGHDREVSVRHGVVLSGGALSSPAVLLRSGIGCSSKLKRHGIDTVHELKEVGENLQDHLQVKLIFETNIPETLNDYYPRFSGKLKILKDYVVNRSGWLTGSGGAVGAFAATGSDSRPDIQYHVMPFSAVDPRKGLDKFSGFTISSCQLRPLSRGSLDIRGRDPLERPRICFNYLREAVDQETMIRGVRLARDIAGSAPLSDLIKREVLPRSPLGSDSEILSFIRNYGGTVYHPAGTCRMGNDPTESVVDSQLKVHGVEGLYVADASIMPTIISGNTNAPSMMIGEMAARFIHENHK